MQTTPLAKAITTLEGQLVALSNVVLTAGAVANYLPAKEAAYVVTAQNVALVVQRLVLKVKASPVATEIIDSPDPLDTALEDADEFADLPA